MSKNKLLDPALVVLDWVLCIPLIPLYLFVLLLFKACQIEIIEEEQELPNGKTIVTKLAKLRGEDILAETHVYDVDGEEIKGLLDLTTKKITMASTTYNKYINSPEWQLKRQEAFKAYGRQCMVCISPNDLHIHHRNYDRFTDEAISDLLVLCMTCHALLHKQARIRSRKFKQLNHEIASGHVRSLGKTLVVSSRSTRKKKNKTKPAKNLVGFQASIEAIKYAQRQKKTREKKLVEETKTMRRNKVYNPILGTYTSARVAH